MIIQTLLVFLNRYTNNEILCCIKTPENNAGKIQRRDGNLKNFENFSKIGYIFSFPPRYYIEGFFEKVEASGGTEQFFGSRYRKNGNRNHSVQFR